MILHTLHSAVHRNRYHTVLIADHRVCGDPRRHVRQHATVCCKAIAQHDSGVIIVGGGIAGWATAAALTKAGIPHTLLEDAPAILKGGTSVALWKNAFRALQALGIADTLRQQHPLQIDTVELCSSDGRKLRSFSLEECSGGPHELRAVMRSTLLHELAAVAAPEDVCYGVKATAVQQHAQGGATVLLDNGKQISGRCVVACDGARSAIATQLGAAPLRFAGQAAYRGIATFPDGIPLPLNITRQVYGYGTRAGMTPVSPTQLYWFTCFNANEDVPAIQTASAMQEAALASVDGFAWQLQDVIAATPAADIVRSRLYDRNLWPSSPAGQGCITFAGDALHPSTPNLGQGGCMALEDAVILAQALAKCWDRDDAAVQGALREYEAQRMARAAPLVQRAFVMGLLLGIPFWPVVHVRELVMAKVFNPTHYLDHATFDCGEVPQVTGSPLAAQTR